MSKSPVEYATVTNQTSRHGKGMEVKFLNGPAKREFGGSKIISQSLEEAIGVLGGFRVSPYSR